MQDHREQLTDLRPFVGNLTRVSTPAATTPELGPAAGAKDIHDARARTSRASSWSALHAEGLPGFPGDCFELKRYAKEKNMTCVVLNDLSEYGAGFVFEPADPPARTSLVAPTSFGVEVTTTWKNFQSSQIAAQPVRVATITRVPGGLQVTLFSV